MALNASGIQQTDDKKERKGEKSEITLTLKRL
jgi:hypothetical protein